MAGRLASSEMRTSAPDLRLSSPVHALRSAVGRGLASWPIAEVLAVRWRWCSFPLATFAVCQAARQSRLAARVLAAARTTGTLKMTPRRAPKPPIVLGLDFATLLDAQRIERYGSVREVVFSWFSFVDRSVAGDRREGRGSRGARARSAGASARHRAYCPRWLRPVGPARRHRLVAGVTWPGPRRGGSAPDTTAQTLYSAH